MRKNCNGMMMSYYADHLSWSWNTDWWGQAGGISTQPGYQAATPAHNLIDSHQPAVVHRGGHGWHVGNTLAKTAFRPDAEEKILCSTVCTWPDLSLSQKGEPHWNVYRCPDPVCSAVYKANRQLMNRLARLQIQLRQNCFTIGNYSDCNGGEAPR